MKKPKSFKFGKSRRVTPAESEQFRKAIEKKLSVSLPKRGRPPKGEEKFVPISIRLHPLALARVKKEAKRLGVGYQTVINRILLKRGA
jgi:hypothetical protein